MRLRLWECKYESAIARLQLRVQNERAPNTQLILLVWAGIQWRPRKTTENTSSLRITNILCCTPPSQGARRRWPMSPRREHRPEWLCCPAGIRKLKENYKKTMRKLHFNWFPHGMPTINQINQLLFVWITPASRKPIEMQFSYSFLIVFFLVFL